MTGNDLKDKRGELGYSQGELALALGVALSTVARWEQMKDEDIPGSVMLELALETIINRAKKGGKK
jgi:transcriptional regulator with XRE-family HTH domain